MKQESPVKGKTGRPKKIQKSVYFDPDVWEALEKQMKISANSNISVVVNDGLRYAMFPEHRNDRDADLVKLYHQFSASLADHRKKTARDLAFIQEMILNAVKTQYLTFPPVPEKELEIREVSANARLNQFMEHIVQNMSELRPLSDRERKAE
ncbi:MAG: hypothetical protein RBT80_26220 [Candidatus Vecturithrix sp.]|jgi:hypothetical protein|nr:hypothetical protein [Candidatus Vecturithrix sp.]